jgi:hypothetical protein
LTKKLKFKSPYKFSNNCGLECNGLDEAQLKLLQRFMPQFDQEKEEDESQKGSIFYDTNGFFIAKFLKNKKETFK